jgi:hypothetical protein
MFWITAASVLIGVLLGACLGFLMMNFGDGSNCASEPVRVRDWE